MNKYYIVSGGLKKLVLSDNPTDACVKALHSFKGTIDPYCFYVDERGFRTLTAEHAIDIEDVRQLMDVNVVGLLALTKMSIPLLKKSKGRIINIGSTSSYLSIPGGICRVPLGDARSAGRNHAAK